MKVNYNQTALDVTFDISGSLAGYTSFLSQLPEGERVGFDTYPDLLDVADIGQTWSPYVENLTLAITLKLYNDKAILKAPYNTDLKGMQGAIDWGEAIIGSLFDRSLWIAFEPSAIAVFDELKHTIKANQTIIDVSFDLSGSLSGITTLLNQLPIESRIGFADMPQLWEDVSELNQTWTPDVENKKFEFDVNVYSLASVKKRPYATDLLSLVPAITWGNDFLSSEIVVGDYAVDEVFNFGVDENNNFITT